MRKLKQSTARNVAVFATLATDHISPATGKTLSVTISKNGAAFAALNGGGGAVTEVSSGWYKIALDSTDTNTVGDLLVHATEGTIDNIDAILGEVEADTATILADLDDIQTRLPATLDSGNMRSAVKAMDANVITASVIATDAIGAAELAADAVTEIQSGLATAAALDAVDNFVDTEVADIVTRVTDIQARLPAALDGSGFMKSQIKGFDNDVLTAAATDSSFVTEVAGGISILDANVVEWDGDPVATPTTPGVPLVEVSALGTDTITSSVLAASAITEIQSGLATAAALATVDDFVDTEVADIVTRVTDIQARLPATLDGGNMRSAVKAMDAGVITATVIAADAIGASELAADAVTEIQSGLATAAALATVDDFIDTEVATLVTGVADIQSRLPATLIGGNMRSNVQAMANNVITSAVIATDAIDADALAADAVAEIGGGGGGVAILASPVTSKLQFTSNEDLQLIFPPFIDRTTGDPILGTDAITLTIRRPNGTLLPGPPAPIFDADVELWTASVSSGSFSAGTWMILAESDASDTQGQRQVLTWGDYVDDIPETRQAALGRWRIDSTSKKLFLYEDDGTTVFKEFDLKDAGGTPSVAQVFERDPV